MHVLPALTARTLQAAHLLGDPPPSPPEEESPSAIPSHLSPWLQPVRTSSRHLIPSSVEAEPARELTFEMKTLMARGYQEDDCKVKILWAISVWLHVQDGQSVVRGLEAAPL